MFIFLGFAGSALLANRRSMLYYGGLAGSLLGIMVWASLANIFFIRSSSMFSAELYLGLIAFAGFGKIVAGWTRTKNDGPLTVTLFSCV
jgi:hypothetical protein